MNGRAMRMARRLRSESCTVPWRPGVARRLRRDDSGQVMVLTLGLVVLAIALVVVVVAASALHLERARLLALADLAALAAAGSVADEAYFGGAPADALLTDTAVRTAVEDYLRDLGADDAARWGRLEVAEASSPDGRTAQVSLVAVARPPLIGWVLAPWSDGVTVTATSSARS